MSAEINYIQIGKTRQELSTRQWVSKWMPAVSPETAAAPPQTNDGTIHVRNVDEWLRPEIDFSYNFKDPEGYADASRILLLGTFVCRFYMPEINGYFTGAFRLTNASVALFIRTAHNKYAGVSNFTFKARSIYTFDSWEQLIEYADNDPRVT